MSARYRVIVPVQHPAQALPRSGWTTEVRERLSRAFARDTLTAVRRCRSVHEVVVVSPDPDVSRLAGAFDAGFVLASQGSGLNEAVDEAHRASQQTGDQMVAALVSDLPALGRSELEEVLSSVGRRRVTTHVLDLGHRNVTLQLERASTFTSCLARDPARRRVPRGTPLAALVPGVRCDVDTPAGLQVAAYVGVGAATSRAMTELARELRSRRKVA